MGSQLTADGQAGPHRAAGPPHSVACGYRPDDIAAAGFVPG